MNIMLLALLSGLCLMTGIVLTFGLATGRMTLRASGCGNGRLAREARRLWRGSHRGPAARKKHQQRIIAGAIAGIAVWIVTGMPVFGLATLIAVPGLPWLLGAGKLEEASIARLHAIESWTRRLKDIVHKGIGLQQAIIASLTTTPPEIYTEVRDLVARLQSGADITTALYQFADDLDEEYSDEVIAPLILQVSMRGAKMGHRLVDIADDIAEDINDRTENQSRRAEGQYTLKVLTAMVLGLLAAGLFAPSYVEPFTHGIGQVILLTGVAALISRLMAGRRLSMPPATERFLRPPAKDDPTPQQDMAEVRAEMEAAR